MHAKRLYFCFYSKVSKAKYSCSYLQKKELEGCNTENGLKKLSVSNIVSSLVYNLFTAEVF